MKKLAAVLLIFAAFVAGISGDLKVGDKAPPMKVAEWVKGQPVPTLQQGRVYVVEFWASWCGPCVDGIPHLTELAKKYAESVTIIGVNVWEDPDATDNSYFATVKSFVEKMGSKMDYVVGIDGPEGEMAKTWMEAAGQNGIPAAFVVNGDGIIVWIGHPMNLDGVLEKVIAGTWDLETAKKHAQAEREVNDLLNSLYNELETVSADEQKALEFAARIDKHIEEKPALLSHFAVMKFQALLPKHPEKAMDVARTYIKGELRDDNDFLLSVATGILEREDPKMDYALALDATRRFADSAGTEHFFTLDILAMAHYRNGNYVEAIVIGERAVDLVDKDIRAMVESGQEVPEGYQNIRRFLAERVEKYKKRGAR